MDPDPWYAAGLRFRCTMCGQCCTGAPGFVWVNEDEIAAIADFLQRPHRPDASPLHTRVVNEAAACARKPTAIVCFTTRAAGCTIYEVRPAPVPHLAVLGIATSRRPHAWQHTCEICPGSGQGDLIPAEEITRRMNVIRL